MSTPRIVTLQRPDGAEVVIIGTKHLGRLNDAPLAVERLIAQHKPQSVVAELDADRLKQLFRKREDDLPAVLDVLPNAPEAAHLRVSQWVLISALFFATRAREPLTQILMSGSESDAYAADVRAAVDACRNAGASLVLGDRSVMLTMSRWPVQLSDVLSTVISAPTGIIVDDRFPPTASEILRFLWGCLIQDPEVVADVSEAILTRQRTLDAAHASTLQGKREHQWNSLMLSAVRKGCISVADWTTLKTLSGALGLDTLDSFDQLRNSKTSKVIAAPPVSNPIDTIRDAAQIAPSASAPMRVAAAVEATQQLVTSVVNDAAGSAPPVPSPASESRDRNAAVLDINDERDEVLAWAIAHAPGPKVVAVVGQGHLPGIQRHWLQVSDDRVRELCKPEPHSAVRAYAPLAGWSVGGLAVLYTLRKRRSRLFMPVVGGIAALGILGGMAAGGAIAVSERTRMVLRSPRRGPIVHTS